MLTILAALLAQPPGLEAPVAQKMVTLPMAARNPDYWDIPIEVCGHVVASRREDMALLYGHMEWLYVDLRGRTPLKVGTAACLTGVVRRRDGLSHREAVARNLPFVEVVDAADSSRALRPCDDRKSCELLMPKP